MRKSYLDNDFWSIEILKLAKVAKKKSHQLQHFAYSVNIQVSLWHPARTYTIIGVKCSNTPSIYYSRYVHNLHIYQSICYAGIFRNNVCCILHFTPILIGILARYHRDTWTLIVEGDYCVFFLNCNEVNVWSFILDNIICIFLKQLQEQIW